MICVITTIQQPTKSVVALAARLHDIGGKLVVIGDKKSPTEYNLEGADFFSLYDQFSLEFKLKKSLPTDHYTRKNIGYLIAITTGCDCIFETDDDNEPLDTWTLRREVVKAIPVSANGWLNIYRHFSSEQIWPRGFPLELIRRPMVSPASLIATAEVKAPIQQGLVNGSPDVDAVWRLLLDKDFQFDSGDSLWLRPGAWCPFNSQSTWWFPEAYPLMYLPSYVSFRMTDIWRSFIAQRCLWEMGYGVVFHGPEMFQERNPHNLLHDFEQEIPGYLGNSKICELLQGLQLSQKSCAAGDNLYRCYEALIAAKFVPKEEITLVEAWLEDVSHSVSACLEIGSKE